MAAVDDAVALFTALADEDRIAVIRKLHAGVNVQDSPALTALQTAGLVQDGEPEADQPTHVLTDTGSVAYSLLWYAGLTS